MARQKGAGMAPGSGGRLELTGANKAMRLLSHVHALTALASLPELAKRHLGKVKLCYIGPPFNTGDRLTKFEILPPDSPSGS